MVKYWDTDYPTYGDLKDKYEYIWSFTRNSKNKIRRIEKISEYIYDLYTQYEYYNLKKKRSFSLNSTVRFVFGKDGKIIKAFGLKNN